MGSVNLGVANCITGNNPSGFIVIVAAGVEVAVIKREIAAGHFQANAMAGREVIAGGVVPSRMGIITLRSLRTA